MLPLPKRFIPPLGPPRLGPRDRVLAQWRGYDLGRLEKVRSNPPKSANALVAGVLKTLRIDQRRSDTEILRVWNQLLDPVLTVHAQPTGLVRGTLFVKVDSNVWLHEIVRYRYKEILERLQHSFGKDLVTRISFRCG